MFNFDEAGKKSREAMEGMLESYSEMARGSRRSLNDACQLQAAYVTSSCSSLVDEGGKLGGLYADLAKSACRHYDRPAAATPTAVAATEAG